MSSMFFKDCLNCFVIMITNQLISLSFDLLYSEVYKVVYLLIKFMDELTAQSDLHTPSSRIWHCIDMVREIILRLFFFPRSIQVIKSNSLC